VLVNIALVLFDREWMLMKKFTLQLIFGIFFVFCWNGAAYANQFCFASAKTFYEQVYCELQAKGKTKGMPSFEQFSRNNEIVQASLLKGPAERNGIKLPAAKKNQSATVDTSQSKKADTKGVDKRAVDKSRVEISEDTKPPVKEIPFQPPLKSKIGFPEKNCQMLGSEIKCSSGRYKLIGNKNNKHLAEGVLLESNKMDFSSQRKGTSTHQYLASIYRQYIEKMCAIGLGGVTMTYGKFTYLFEDLQSKKVDFNKRFEIMYSFLKKDKATMWVSDKVVTNSRLVIEDCDYLSDQYFVCSVQGHNYIYEFQSASESSPTMR
jgi:hypothetical protein